jgi:tight adherence protein B
VVTKILDEYRVILERASITVSVERLAGGIAGGALIGWLAYLFVAKPGPLIAVIALVAALALATAGCNVYVKRLVKKRVGAFNGQLEMALRLVCSGLRVGLSLRQALVLVIDELPDPARHEFMRVVGQTNIGVSMYDALDKLRERVPSDEVGMMVRAIRIQSQTGGNLAKVLENLADTIKSRRRIDRKIKVLTSESRASAFIICALPFGVGGMIMVMQPHMREVMLTSMIGHLALVGVVVLEALGALTVSKMMNFAV